MARIFGKPCPVCKVRYHEADLPLHVKTAHGISAAKAEAPKEKTK